MNIQSHTAFGIGLTAALFSAALFLPAPALAWNLQGACAGTPATARVGDTITWTATQTSTLLPGQGHYEWNWSGTDGLSGVTQSVSKTYATPGTKNATVSIKLVLTSGKVESITRTCSITITQSPSPATLTVIKRVINDNGGTKIPADFMLHVKSGTGDVSGSPAPGSSVGTTYTLPPGTYTVSEDAPSSGYMQTGFSGDCAQNGSVTLASGGTKTCTLTNDDNPPSGGIFTGACAVTPPSGAIGSSFTWSAYATGGTGSYTYSWAGDEGLTGASQTVTKSYATAGAKNGTVVITSGSESILRSCAVTVTTTTTETPFDGMCAVSPATASVGETVQWSSSASGGTGTYAYSWSGDEGLTGITNTLAKAYGSAETKLGTVTILSGLQSVTKTCAVSITPPPGCMSGCGGGFNQPNVVLLKKATSTTLASASVYVSQTPQSFAAASVYLSQIPYTGVAEGGGAAIAFIALLLAITGIISYLLVSSRKKSDTHLFKPTIHLTELTSGKEISKTRSESIEAEAPDASLFVSWLVAGESQRVFDYLRALNGQSADRAAFVTNLASELDLVYRNRLDARAPLPPEHARKAVEEWSNERIEEVISILVGSVDESYRSNETAIKLAMAKIMKLGA